MADGNNRKAIMPQGIVRNQTKIGVQDGQSDDLVNLRFLDGSWRASGNGRLIDNFSGTGYTQLYVHTNVYHHLLGVSGGTLYWFAEIGTDGVTFYPLDGTTARGNWPEDMQGLPTEPKELTTVHGDLWITQTGHLLTIIDEADDFEHFVFKTSTKEYIEVNMDVNGKATDRSLYPFGQVHFNLYSPWRPNNLDTFDHAVLIETGSVETEHDSDFYWVKPDVPSENAIEALGRAAKKNIFINPFLACLAIRLYDDSFLYATNPVLLYPRQVSSSGVRYYDARLEDYRRFDLSNSRTAAGVYYNTSVAWVGRKYGHWVEELRNEETVSGFFKFPENLNPAWTDDTRDDLPSFMAGIVSAEAVGYTDAHVTWMTLLLGSDLVCSIDSELANMMEQNSDIFSSICVFVTPEVSVYDFDKDKAIPFKRAMTGYVSNCQGDTIFFKRKTPEEISKELTKQPFFLLKEYKEANELLDNPRIDLTEQESLLSNLVQQDRLPIESTSRTTYLPKVSYMYNGRLHIANYKTHPFFGYPIDLFHLHNHSVKVEDGAWFPADEAGKRVLPNLADNNDAYLQYPRTQHNFIPYDSLGYYAFVSVDIDTAQGMQRVVRYISPYDLSSAENGRADFIESLNPILTYPDARAKHMTIVVLGRTTSNMIFYKEMDLKPHPYLNIAYYIAPNLKPISFSHSAVLGRYPLPEIQYTEEHFPNGLKVSKTDQPMFFPVENAYQVGSAEILALMSNAIAVGTGQTGAAPLYVFCKDGIYALYVDASGEMAYKNARILARDVCNNARSVTPINTGVVFTTDRGLMEIAGEQVQEIGAPAEGDVFRIEDYEDAPYDHAHPYVAKKIMWHRFTSGFFANLPAGMLDGVDFLTYISGAIINYNHNMRELMVTNPNYPYSYVMDREGQWSRRSFTADEYVNNYPTSYRVEGGTFYKVDDEGDANTSLEHRKEADNGIFWLSNIIKLDSIGFKELHRLVIRGYFETVGGNAHLGLYVFGSYDGRQWALIGGNERKGKWTDLGCKIERTDIKFFRVCLAGKLSGKSRIDHMEVAFDPSILDTKIR